GSTNIQKPSPPYMFSQRLLVTPPGYSDSPTQELLSCSPPYTPYGRSMSTLTWYNWEIGRLSAFHHSLAASYEYHTPPSSPVIRWSVLLGSIHTSWKSPCAPPEMLLKLRPPSVLTISGPSGL